MIESRSSVSSCVFRFLSPKVQHGEGHPEAGEQRFEILLSEPGEAVSVGHSHLSDAILAHQFEQVLQSLAACVQAGANIGEHEHLTISIV